MRKILFLGLMLVCTLLIRPQAFSQDEAAKPSYKNGETWLFAVKEGGSIGSSSSSLNGTYELVILDSKLKISTVTGSQKDELEPRPLALLGLLTFAPNLSFPLTVGKQWSRDYKIAFLGSNKPVARKITYEVKGIEEVTTGAGTFRAFKLESDDRSHVDFWTTTYWYSPETRSIVKSLFDSTSAGKNPGLKREIELVTFTPVK